MKDGANAVSKDPAAPGDINATDAQCRAERRLVETAVETYTILQGAPPVDEAALVPDWLRVQSVFMDLDVEGNVVPAPGSGCP